MKVRDVMTTEVRTVRPETTYAEAARLLFKYKFSGLPVVDEKGELIGMLSEKDLFRALYPRYAEYIQESARFTDHEAREAEAASLRREPIAKFMSRTLHTIHPDAPILKAGGVMLVHQIHRLPVLESKTLVGIVTREDIYSAILKTHFDSA